jgi:Secretion system C-terminal sorting domain
MKINRYPFKTFLFIVCTGIGLINPGMLRAQLCSNPNTLFGMDNNAKLYPVNSTTAAVGAVINSPSYTSIPSYTSLLPITQFSSPSSPNGLGYNSVNGKLYYFKRDPGGSGAQFVSFDPAINKYTTLATTPITNTVHSACINFNGSGYYCLDVSSKLYYYDIALNTWTFITSNFTDQFGNNVSTVFSTMSTGDMAIDGLNNMWILPSTNTNYSLYKMVAPLPTTAVASITVQQVVPPTKPTPSGVSIWGVAFDASGNLYMSTSSGQLYKLTSPTATPLLIGTMSITMTDLSSCAFPFSVLPVTWTNFSGNIQSNGTVLLNWTMTAQPGSKGFIVEHSTDGINWQQVGFVQSSAINRSSYSFTDPNTVNGKNFYRLQLLNNDGSFVYSKIVAVTIKNTEKISLWPNPVTDRINIRLGNNNTNGAYAITYDAGGKAITKSNLQPGINTIYLQSLPAGSYTVQVHFQNGEIRNEKIVKQ